MASHLTSLDLFIWLGVIASEAAVLVFLLVRSLHRRFPIFFCFIGLGLLEELFMLYVAFHMSALAYFYCYWAQVILEYLLQLAILYEVMKELFGQLEVLPKQALKLFLTGCFGITGVLALISITFPEQNFGRLYTLIIYLERGSEFLRAAVLLLLIPFVSILGLRWKHYAFGIVLGLGLFSTIDLLSSTVGATLFPNAIGIPITRYIPKIAYLASFLIWIEYFRKPEPARAEVSPEVLTALKGVSNQLEDLYTSPAGMVRRLMWQSSLQR